jgi:hypothetical protein
VAVAMFETALPRVKVSSERRPYVRVTKLVPPVHTQECLTRKQTRRRLCFISLGTVFRDRERVEYSPLVN